MNRLTAKFIFFFLMIVLVAGGALIFTVDQKTWEYLKALRPEYLLATLLVLILNWFFDAYRVLILARGVGEKVTWSNAWQVVFSNYFLGVLTPASAGGFVAQMYFLKRGGIPAGKATALVLVRTMLSLAFMLCLFPLVIINDFFSLSYLANSILPFFAFSILLVLSIIFLFFYPRTLEKLFLAFLNLAFIRSFLAKKSWDRKLENIFADLVKAIECYTGKSRKALLLGFLYSGISLLFLFSTVPLILLGLNFSPDFFKILGRVVLLNFFLYFAPTPGGAGVAEGGLMLLLKGLIPFNILGIVAILWRFLAEYLPFFIGLLVCLRALGLEKMGQFLRSEDK